MTRLPRQRLGFSLLLGLGLLLGLNLPIGFNPIGFNSPIGSNSPIEFNSLTSRAIAAPDAPMQSYPMQAYPMQAQPMQPHSAAPPEFERIEQPLAVRLGVTAAGLGLIGLELWWFLFSKPKPKTPPQPFSPSETQQGI